MIELSNQQRTALRFLLLEPASTIAVAKAVRIKSTSAFVMLGALRSRGLVVQGGRTGPNAIWRLNDAGRAALNAGGVP